MKKRDSGKLKDSHIKKFLKSYYDGNPLSECPKGCSNDCILTCYIEIHQSLVDDDGKNRNFKEPYMRDGIKHCCGAHIKELPNGKDFCEVCGAEY